jgi:hypothetical protein
MRTMRIVLFIAIIFSSSWLLGGEPLSASRSSGMFRVTILLSDSQPRGIASIVLQYGRDQYKFPNSLFDDIRNPHIGSGFKPSAFFIEAHRSNLSVSIASDGSKFPEEHTWLIPLPPKEASRITRSDNKTGFAETRPSTLLLK